MKIKFFGRGLVKDTMTNRKLFKFENGEYIAEEKELSEKVINKLKNRFKWEEVKPKRTRTKKKVENINIIEGVENGTQEHSN